MAQVPDSMLEFLNGQLKSLSHQETEDSNLATQSI